MAELTISASDIAGALKKNLEGFAPSVEARTVGRVAEVQRERGERGHGARVVGHSNSDIEDAVVRGIERRGDARGVPPFFFHLGSTQLQDQGVSVTQAQIDIGNGLVSVTAAAGLDCVRSANRQASQKHDTGIIGLSRPDTAGSRIGYG